MTVTVALKVVGAAGGGLAALALLVYVGMWAGDVSARIEHLEQDHEARIERLEQDLEAQIERLEQDLEAQIERRHAQPVPYTLRDCPQGTELVRRESDEQVLCRPLGLGSPTAR